MNSVTASGDMSGIGKDESSSSSESFSKLDRDLRVVSSGTATILQHEIIRHIQKKGGTSYAKRNENPIVFSFRFTSLSFEFLAR